MEEVGCPKAQCQVAALPFNDEQRQSVCTLGCPRVKSQTGLYPEGRERVKKGSLSGLVGGRCDKQRTYRTRLVSGGSEISRSSHPPTKS